MSHGKNICQQLKAIRRSIAEENNIPLEIPVCTYQGECRGTCPRCEAEVRYLEQQLAQHLKMGRVATVAGVAVSLAALTACNNSSSPSITPPDTTPTTLDTVTVCPQPELPDAAIQAEGIVTSPSGEQHIQAANKSNKPVKRKLDEISIIATQMLGLISNDEPSCTPQPAIKPDDSKFFEVGEIGLPFIDAMLPPKEIEEGEIEEEGEIFVVTEEDPEFPDGMEAMYKFIADNIRYPKEARDSNVSGKVYVRFVVEKDGTVSHVRVLRDIGAGCGQEAARIVRSMPKWKPGRNQGKAVAVEYNLPIKFELN